MGEMWDRGDGASEEGLGEGDGATADIFRVGDGAVGDGTGTDTSSSSLRVRSMTMAGSFLGCEFFLSTEHWVVTLDADSLLGLATEEKRCVVLTAFEGREQASSCAGISSILTNEDAAGDVRIGDCTRFLF